MGSNILLLIVVQQLVLILNQWTLEEINPEYPLKGLMLKLNSNTLATWCKKLAHWKKSWCWERLKAGGEGDDRGWNGCMVSLTQWTWVWASSGSWWWTGRPGVLQSMGRKESDRTEWVNKNNCFFSPFHFFKVKIISYLLDSKMHNPLHFTFEIESHTTLGGFL